MKHFCCDSTVAPITMIISEVGRQISQLQQNRFSSLFHTQIACKTLETYFSCLPWLPALRNWGTLAQRQEWEELYKNTRSGAMGRGRTLLPKWFISTVDAEKGSTEPSVACQNKVLNTSPQTLAENAALQQGTNCKRLLVPRHSSPGTHHSLGENTLYHIHPHIPPVWWANERQQSSCRFRQNNLATVFSSHSIYLHQWWTTDLTLWCCKALH